MSDLTDLLDNAADLLVRLRNIEQSWAWNDPRDMERELACVDPVEVRDAIRDLREVSLRTKALDELGDGTTVGTTAATAVAPDSAQREVAPSVPEPYDWNNDRHNIKA